MTRLLVLGTSQAATLSLAPDLEGALPGVQTRFYALPGASWSRARLDEAGRLGPAPDDRIGRAKSVEWNGCAALDMAGTDHIAVCAPRFRLFFLARSLRERDIFGLPRTGADHAISAGLLTAALADWVREEIAALRPRLPVGVPVSLLAVPYPLASDAPGAPQEDAALVRLRLRPAAARIEAIYEAVIAAEVAAAGWRWLAQPAATRAGPFASADRFARPGAFDPARPDLRHMNADYAALAMAELGQSLPPAPPVAGMPARHPLPAAAGLA
ncbi:hypothetical protein V8J36_15925 [Frigidibacter sp. MR17.14]|uniref:hypothetical protein n=1 Tax=Frigidibacter sp. MR17.14 TaxID=3126509 RepID=UPI003012DC20